ncbi:inactive serine protease scarface isoform X2 [Eurosta solidaginis]|uniref:inactive serine protease scarface isoform X2 n=1 Tax=Eurosta solidaginis TaxID=178769 RepID=UPI003530B88A
MKIFIQTLQVVCEVRSCSGLINIFVKNINKQLHHNQSISRTEQRQFKMLWSKHFLFGLSIALCWGCSFAQFSSNIFLNGEYQNSIKANPSKIQSINPASNVFLEHAIISRQASPFQGPTYLPPEEILKCSAGKQCVLKEQCVDGNFANPSLKAQNCRPSTHTCCIYRPPPPSPPPTTTERPFDVCSGDHDCVPSRLCSNGEIDLEEYVRKSKSDRCYYPDICCRIPSTTLTDDGYVLRTPEVQFIIPTTGRPYQASSSSQQISSPHQPIPQRDYLPPNTFSKPITPSNQYIPPTAATPPRQVFTQQPPYNQDAASNKIPQRPQPGLRPENVYIPPNPEYQPSDYHVTQPSNTVIQTVTTAAPPKIAKPTPPQRGEDILSLPLHRQHLSKCASALECTPENFCNSIGVIVDQPVDTSSAESAFRVPLTDCVLENGLAGKCCRDANYVDPWPINLAGVCATRNSNTKPQGIQDVDANFGEIPWQAMILKESTKTLLGGGAIIGDQVVLTAASVVKGVLPNDLKVKGGEWELGRDSEPLPFQIVGVKSIDIHPKYNPSTGSNDMAVLRLDKRLEFAQHVKPICVTNEDPKPGEKCITTGWGKQAIKSHEEGAIMHVSNTISQPRESCGADETSVCSSIVSDPCLFDVGGALACGTGSNVMLKGVYTAENACGEGQTVRFAKPDLKWVNGFFTLQNKDKVLKKRRV